MDDESAALIDVAMIAVENGEGAYPDGFQWADPDIGDAAAWMRGWSTSQRPAHR